MNASKITFVGVGNTLAGDDGAGVVLLRELQSRIGSAAGVVYKEIPGDLYEIWDILPTTETIVFLDAVAGETAGELFQGKTLVRAFCPSFHQSDLCSVVDSLATIYDGEFPQWTLWGVTIDPPLTLGEGLSSIVDLAVRRAADEIAALLLGAGLPVGDNLVKL